MPMDNMIIRVLTRIFDFILLNILWVVCSIPIVTMGASTAALYSVMLKITKNQDGYIIKDYFKAFCENFRQGTIVWMILALLGSLIGADMAIVSRDVRNRGVSGHRSILHNRLLLLCRSALRLSINCRIQEQYGQYDEERDTDSSLQTALCITRPAFDGDVPDPYFPQSDVDFGRGCYLERDRSIGSYICKLVLYTQGAGTLYGGTLMVCSLLGGW